MLMFFSTACILTQCSKAVAGFVADAISNESNKFSNNEFSGSSSLQSDENSGPTESETGLVESTGGKLENTGEETIDTGLGPDSMDTSSDWQDENPPGTSGDLVDFKITYDFLIPGDTDSIMFITGIPKDYKYRQEIKDYGFSVRPDRIFSDDDNKYAMFNLINPVNKFFINMDIQIELFDFDLLAAQKNPGNLGPGKSLLAEYLVSEGRLEADDPQIKETAESFGGSNQLEIVSRIYSFVLDRMQYSGYNPSDVGAAKALARGTGDCTEYSDLFVALCRAKGIPARVIEGYSTDSGTNTLSFGHNWTEVYLDDFGWVPLDPIYDDNNGDSAETTFENLQNVYVYTGFKRNDDILHGYHYYAYNFHGDAIEVIKTVTVN